MLRSALPPVIQFIIDGEIANIPKRKIFNADRILALVFAESSAKIPGPESDTLCTLAVSLRAKLLRHPIQKIKQRWLC
jgi:hypothetical protein